ncbi:MAG TPA: FAD-binding oxidoreductase [Pyrinomonadaceae bacterium]|nr:FAD-binding oxidoreductase [Pyrinomonadaceae bacterium]
MLTKSEPDEIQDYLSDASHVSGGYAASVLFPETAAEVAAALAGATRDQTPLTISGAGTGTVSGRVPFGGSILATDRLNTIKSIEGDSHGGHAIVEAGTRLIDIQRAVELQGLIYPPDPTERTCFIGGNISTNASGARTFKYGPTRNYVNGLQVALTTGDVISLRRGELRAGTHQIQIPLAGGRTITAQLPSYQMPQVRKHASGYYVAPGMDAIDLFIGSEGTLGVIVEAELKLIPGPEGLLSGVVFFAAEANLLAFVRDVRERSLQHRLPSGDDSPAAQSKVDARALEYLDIESLRFLRQKYPSIPDEAVGAIFFEQETSPATEDELMTEWLSLLEKHQALADGSWFATNEQDQAQLREFRHALPVLMNEWFSGHHQKKVSTDMAVPDDQFAGMLRFYQEHLRGGDLRCTIFGHIGDNHVHVNILPRNDDEAQRAWVIYRKFIRRAIDVGGTISAEHGIGKLKREYLREMYGERHLREMVALKRAFDPQGILGRGNMFDEQLLEESR